MTESPQLFQAAIYYVDTLGFSVIPIIPGEKRPATPWTEYQKRRPTREELVEWFHEGDYQLGVVCGAVSGNLVVLDFETPGSYTEWAGRHAGLAKKTRTVETGKGVHVYVRLDKRPAGNAKLIPGLVETRGEGGMVLAPPSLHPSGKAYRLRGAVRDVVRTTWEKVGEGEEWGVVTVGAKISATAAAETIMSGNRKGNRNDAVFNAAVVLRDGGKSAQEAYDILVESNQRSEPPLEDGEIKRTVGSAFSRDDKKDALIGIDILTFQEALDAITMLKKEQASYWLKKAIDDNAKEPNWATKVRALVKKCGGLDEVEFQEVIERIEQRPPLLAKKRTELKRIWYLAKREIQKAVQGKATDDEIADALKAAHLGQRMFTRGQWWQWNGSGVWTSDVDMEDEVWRMLIVYKDMEVKPSLSKQRSVEACLKGQSWFGVPEPLVDAKHDLLNLLNGVYDLNDSSLTAHAPDQYLTTQLPFEHDPDAACPKWFKFLAEVLVDEDGNSSQRMINFMQEAFGYSLTAETKYEICFWLLGDGGNGKSTVIYILTKLSGSGATAINLGMLERNEYQLALLPGKRVVTCTESPVGMRIADSYIKSLVSGEPMVARLPRENPFTLHPVCKVWWAMNDPPRVADTSDGFWRRIRLVPFLAKFLGKAVDEDLKYKLEAELPGIFNWALKGLQRLRDEGWTDSTEISASTGAYRESNDIEQAFVDACCETSESYQIMAGKLYTVYSEWCRSTGHLAKSMTRVASDWKRLGFKRGDRTGKGFPYYGLRLRVSHPPEPDY